MYKRSGSSISDEQSLTDSIQPADSSSQPQVQVAMAAGTDHVMSPSFGIRLLLKTGLPIFESRTFHKTLILALTFAAYSSYHISRRPLSIVKSVLNKNCSDLTPPSWIHDANTTNDGWCDWERKFSKASGVTFVFAGVLPSGRTFKPGN